MLRADTLLLAILFSALALAAEGAFPDPAPPTPATLAKQPPAAKQPNPQVKFHAPPIAGRTVSRGAQASGPRRGDTRLGQLPRPKSQRRLHRDKAPQEVPAGRPGGRVGNEE